MFQLTAILLHPNIPSAQVTDLTSSYLFLQVIYKHIGCTFVQMTADLKVQLICPILFPLTEFCHFLAISCRIT